MTDFKRMTKEELKHYLSTCRNDEEFSAALGERLSRRDPNARKYSANLTFEETGQIIHQEVEELNKDEKIVREKLKDFRRRYIEEISKPYNQDLIKFSQKYKNLLTSIFFDSNKSKLNLEGWTNEKADYIRELSQNIRDFVSGDFYLLSELKEYTTELESLNEDLTGRTSELAGFRLIVGGIGTFLTIVLTIFFRDMTPTFLKDVGVGEHLINSYNAVYIGCISLIILFISAFLVVLWVDSTNRELASLNYFISRGKAFIALAKHIYETESKILKD